MLNCSAALRCLSHKTPNFRHRKARESPYRYHNRQSSVGSPQSQPPVGASYVVSSFSCATRTSTSQGPPSCPTTTIRFEEQWARNVAPKSNSIFARNASATGGFTPHARHCMSKRNWVCFDCRSVVRREDYNAGSVVCATCSAPRVNLGYKIPIPAKTSAKDWESLREEYFASQRAAARVRRDAQRERRHDLQKEIERLESRPANPGRLKAAKLLRKKLRNPGV